MRGSTRREATSPLSGCSSQKPGTTPATLRVETGPARKPEEPLPEGLGGIADVVESEAGLEPEDPDAAADQLSLD